MRNRMITLAAIAAVTNNEAFIKSSAELDGWENTFTNGKDPEKDADIIKAAQEKRERKNQKRLKNA